jgi:O-antigen ligase
MQTQHRDSGTKSDRSSAQPMAPASERRSGLEHHSGLALAASGTAPVFLVAGLIAGYYGPSKVLLLLASAVLGSAVFWRKRTTAVTALDWAMVALAAYEAPSLATSQYATDGLLFARALSCAILFYVLARLTLSTNHQCFVTASLVALGGIALAAFAFSRFAHEANAVERAGLSAIVPFRARLIPVPAPWVLGEWFTLVLLTLPFAAAVPTLLWFADRRIAAIASSLAPLTISAVLLLSCSRAIFWAVVVLALATIVAAALYRVLKPKSALAIGSAALCMFALMLAGENAIYPGIASAYTGRDVSQARSTAGRLDIWKRSIGVLRVSPIWGVGSGNAPLFLTSTGNSEDTTGFASRTFSLPIQILTEKGSLGAALYLTVLLLAAWTGHRLLRNAKVQPTEKVLTCCMAAGIIAVLVRELTYASLLEHPATAMLFALMLAFLAAKEPTCSA